MMGSSTQTNHKSLNRLLSLRGLSSRKEAEQLIRQGKVKVNGKVSLNPFAFFHIKSIIELDGISASDDIPFIYIVMNKAIGTVTTSKDELNRETVYSDLNDFLTTNNISARVFAVGRLDKETEGLLLFTNDNQFADRLTNPNNKVEKKYLVSLSRPISEQEILSLQNGVQINARGKTYVAKPSNITKTKASQILLTLSEGKNREIRRIFETLGMKVTRLKRVGLGQLNLETLNLKTGECRLIKQQDVLDSTK